MAIRAFARRSRLSLAAALLVAAPAAHAADGPTLARELRAGHPVVRSDEIVDGPVDLTGADEVRSLFKCRDCSFTGAVTAPDVTFARMVDLSGSTFDDEVNFRGATFRAPALFRASLGETKAGQPRSTPARFKAGADFSLVFFDEFASFAGSRLDGTAAFRDTRFADATFAAAHFETASFDRASFRGAAAFNGARFKGPAGFAETDFRRRTDFSLATFGGGAVFTRAQFAGDASFLSSRFTSTPESEEAARFQKVASSGNLDFTFADFRRGKGVADGAVIAVFTDLVCGRSLVLRDVTFARGQRVAMDKLQVRDLALDNDVVPQIDDERQQRAVLGMIEESAKARGDLAEANAAHYDLRVLKSRHYRPLRRAFDVLVYRGAAGYFVRPQHPLFLLVLLATLAATARAIWGHDRPSARAQPSSHEKPSGQAASARSRVRRALRRAGRFTQRFLTSVLDTFARLGPARGDDKGKVPALHLRLEAILYKVLFVFALLGLANSNPTLREMVDTLF
jgi:uncharacterized protein YjbI with pentapeptide repeats